MKLLLGIVTLPVVDRFHKQYGTIVKAYQGNSKGPWQSEGPEDYSATCYQLCS